MVNIEELDSKLNVIPLQPAKNATTSGPAVPESIADVKEKSFDERFAELNRIPLFMREMDETDGADGENIALEALKSLAYDGEPWEVATNFKEQGNDCFKAKQYRDAIEFYTKAIQTKCARDEIDETCYVNRAACHLALENYGKVLGDCSRALKLNPKNIKALYRSARACIAVDRLDEAQDVIARGLAIEPENAGMKQQLQLLEQRLEVTLAKTKRDEARREKEHKERENLEMALRQRNITVIKSRKPPDTADAKMCLSDPMDTQSSLLFPTVFLYPLTYQSDFLAAFAEVYTIQSQLDLILQQAPPWDTERAYTPASVECYMETRTRGLIKLGKKVTLNSVLSSGKVDVVDGIVRIYVLPKTQATKWIEDFKREKELTKTSRAS